MSPLSPWHTTVCLLSFTATNLNGGLLRGIEILNNAQGNLPAVSKHAAILIMLTDGEPTEGKQTAAPGGVQVTLETHPLEML